MVNRYGSCLEGTSRIVGEKDTLKKNLTNKYTTIKYITVIKDKTPGTMRACNLGRLPWGNMDCCGNTEKREVRLIQTDFQMNRYLNEPKTMWRFYPAEVEGREIPGRGKPSVKTSMWSNVIEGEEWMGHKKGWWGKEEVVRKSWKDGLKLPYKNSDFIL